MSNLVIPETGEAAFLTEIRTALAALITATHLKVRLFSNNYTPIATTVVSDFTEATFTGYAAQNVPALSTVFTNAAGQAEIDANATNFFQATDAVSPNTIYGYWIADETSTPILMWCEKFDTPIDMTTAGKTLILLLRLILASAF